jgi:hypothetical protein
MACPISFGDCVLALQIIHQIYEQCFKPVNNAQALYLNFQQDIARLGNCLREFKDAFEKALAHVDDIDSYLVDFEPLQVTLKAEADELVGDFKATLEECRDLLKNYVKFERKSGTFLDNLFWHASTQAMVEDLRRRIQSHTYKISLFVEPVKLRLTSDILANTHDILELLRRHFDLVEKIELPEIPAALKKEFRDALNNAPCWITDATQIPLTNGMDALILHYRQSTIQFTGFESNQTVEQYLNLLKAHWLVEILLESKALERTRPGHLYRRIIKQVEQRIAKQYGRREVPRYSEEALCALEKSTFAIWPQKIIVPPRPLTEPVGREEKLAEIPLVRQYSNERRDLFVFRVDDYKLRVVLRRTPDDQSQGSRETTERFFDLRNDGFVPLYTITESPRTEWNVDITYDNSAVPLAYALQSRDDVFKLQRAFTGYVAAAHSERVACAVTYKQATTKNPLGWIRSAVTQHGQQQGRGEIQLWQWPISQTTPLTKKDSIRSGSSHTKAAKVFQASNPSIISRSEVEDGMEVIVAALPPPPLLMAFTESGGTYTIWKTDRK